MAGNPARFALTLRELGMAPVLHAQPDHPEKPIRPLVAAHHHRWDVGQARSEPIERTFPAGALRVQVAEDDVHRMGEGALAALGAAPPDQHRGL